MLSFNFLVSFCTSVFRHLAVCNIPKSVLCWCVLTTCISGSSFLSKYSTNSVILLHGLLLTASSPFLPLFWEHTNAPHLLLGDAVHECLVVSLFSGLVFAVLLGANNSKTVSKYWYYQWSNCKPLFQSLGILTITSQYIIYLMKFLLKNQEKFASSTEVHNINTRNKLKLHKPISNLTFCQKRVYYMSIRIFNKLPDCIARLVENKRCFISTSRQYLVSKSFYSLEEFFDY